MLDSTILHYKIIEKLGEGGMGVVYLAEDSRLKRQVAIKFLPHYIAANKEERQRFEIEAQAAASLNHPNISTVYAIEENDDEVFIVMEYIDGEELKDRINPTSSPLLQSGNTEGLEAGEAVNIAIQIAEGLEAAHKKGIIHRDIKSQNIMITKDGKVKIMDFGLAKVNGGSGLTRIGATVGTIAYMSPEQARGIDVDHRTDIWSFGIILYEMITGQPPFKGEYDQAVIYSILNEEPNEISKNQYPSWIINIALKCLQKDPSDRYQSFSELLTDLKDRRTDSKTTVNSSSGKTAVKIFSVKSFKKKPILIIGLSLGLLILFYLSPSAKELIDSLFSSSPVSSEKHLLILPINSIGGGADRQAFCDGLLETLSSNLSQIERFHGSLWVVPASEVIQNKIKSASEANKMFGVNLVVSGSLQFINDLLRLTLNLIDARNLRQLNSSIIDISFKDISSTQNEAVIKLLEMLNIELEPELKDILDAGKTSVPKAYEYYVQGRGKLQRYENLDNVEEAINLFRMAAKIDTNYALAFAGLGEAYWRCYEITQNSELVELAKEHAKKAFEKDSLLAHTNITLGMIYTGTGNYKLAVLHFKQVVSDNPSDAGANRGLAKAYEASGNITEAELTYKKAVKLKPDYWAGYNDLGAFYYRHSRYEEAINQFKEVIKLTPDNYRGYNNLGGIFYLLERRAEARGMFERSLQIKESYNIYSNLGTLYYVEGKFEDAAESYEQALKLNDKDYLTWGNLAAAYFWIPKKLKESLSAYKKAIDLAEDKLIINPHDPEVTSNLASYYADIGDTSKAMNLLKTSIKIAPDNVMVMYRAAAVYENLGDRDKAISWINKALQNGYSRSEIEHQPEFKNLIADQKYKQLINN